MRLKAFKIFFATIKLIYQGIAIPDASFKATHSGIAMVIKLSQMPLCHFLLNSISNFEEITITLEIGPSFSHPYS